MSKTKVSSPIYQLKVTLRDSKPPIWRRLLISSETSLADLHDIIQVAMGWEDAHLHMFQVGNVQYSMPMEETLDLDFGDERRVRLSDIATSEGFVFGYEYDFGDSWYHVLLVEKILPADPAQALPTCLEGVRACPPEDVGGVWGYEMFLEAIADPAHPEYDDYIDWVDDDFDPAEFDIAAINKVLRRIW